MNFFKRQSKKEIISEMKEDIKGIYTCLDGVKNNIFKMQKGVNTLIELNKENNKIFNEILEVMQNDKVKKGGVPIEYL